MRLDQVKPIHVLQGLYIVQVAETNDICVL